MQIKIMLIKKKLVVIELGLEYSEKLHNLHNDFSLSS